MRAGTTDLLHLDCGHVREVSPLDEKKSYRIAPTQKRAKCNVCEKPVITEKPCFSCEVVKPVSEYYPQRGCSDGYQKRCKPCQLAYTKSLGMKPQGRTALKGSIKARSRSILSAELAQGRMVKPENCEDCGFILPLEGHHDDYMRPLDVRWLCRICHGKWHRKNGEGLNG